MPVEEILSRCQDPQESVMRKLGMGEMARNELRVAKERLTDEDYEDLLNRLSKRRSQKKG